MTSLGSFKIIDIRQTGHGTVVLGERFDHRLWIVLGPNESQAGHSRFDKQIQMILNVSSR